MATVGNIGTEKKMDFTAIGDMVNLASRLEGLTKTYHQQLIFSESLHAKVKEEISCRLLDSVAVKGMPRGLRIYTAQSSLDDKEKEAWDLHNRGMEEYYERKFAQAATRFREVVKILPGDDAAQILMERSREYEKDPPPADWNGVWRGSEP
jgi:hypothetical protein